jgi:hypothetical protein
MLRIPRGVIVVSSTYFLISIIFIGVFLDLFLHAPPAFLSHSYVFLYFVGEAILFIVIPIIFGIGLLRLKSWVMILSLLFGCFLLFMGLLFSSFFIWTKLPSSFSIQSLTYALLDFMQAWRISMVLLIFIISGILTLICLTRPKVRYVFKKKA